MSESLIQQVLSAYKSSDEMTRKQDAADRISLYKDESYDIIQAELRKQFVTENYDNIKQMIDDSLNVTRSVIDEISKVYMEPATRTLIGEDDSEVEDERYAEILEKSMINIVMDKANKYTNLCNECFIYVYPEEDYLSLRLITADCLTVIQQNDDPRKIYAIIYEINLQDTQETVITRTLGLSDEYKQYIYYDIDGRHYKFDSHMRIINNPDNPDNENPYKDAQGRYIIPGVMLHRHYNDASIWDKTSGTRLISAHKQLGVLSTYFNYLLKIQTYKQMVASGNYDMKLMDKQILDPLSVIKIQGEGAEFDILDMQADITSFNVILDKKLERALNQDGLSLSDFQKSGSPESGYKLKIKRQPLVEKRNEQIKHYTIYERQLFDVMRIVNNTMFPNKKINENYQFAIDHGELQFEDDPAERRQEISFDLVNNLTNPYEIIMQERNVDEDQARMIYENNKMINSQAVGGEATQKLTDSLDQFAEEEEVDGPETD